MINNKHTPGNWKLSNKDSLIIRDDIGDAIAVVHNEFRSRTEIEANKRLIVNAPRLLAVAQELMQTMQPGSNLETYGRLGTILAAIAGDESCLLMCGTN